jgi:hypothetical protein
MAGQLPTNVTETALVLVRLPGAGVWSWPVAWRRTGGECSADPAVLLLARQT